MSSLMASYKRLSSLWSSSVDIGLLLPRRRHKIPLSALSNHILLQEKLLHRKSSLGHPVMILYCPSLSLVRISSVDTSVSGKVVKSESHIIEMTLKTSNYRFI